MSTIPAYYQQDNRSLCHTYTKNSSEDQAGGDESDQTIRLPQEQVAEENTKDNTDMPHRDDITYFFRSHDKNGQRIGHQHHDARRNSTPFVITPFLLNRSPPFGENDPRGKNERTN